MRENEHLMIPRGMIRALTREMRIGRTNLLVVDVADQDGIAGKIQVRMVKGIHRTCQVDFVVVLVPHSLVSRRSILTIP